MSNIFGRSIRAMSAVTKFFGKDENEVEAKSKGQNEDQGLFSDVDSTEPDDLRFDEDDFDFDEDDTILGSSQVSPFVGEISDDLLDWLRSDINEDFDQTPPRGMKPFHETQPVRIPTIGLVTVQFDGVPVYDQFSKKLGELRKGEIVRVVSVNHSMFTSTISILWSDQIIGVAQFSNLSGDLFAPVGEVPGFNPHRQQTPQAPLSAPPATSTRSQRPTVSIWEPSKLPYVGDRIVVRAGNTLPVIDSKGRSVGILQEGDEIRVTEISIDREKKMVFAAYEFGNKELMVAYQLEDKVFFDIKLPPLVPSQPAQTSPQAPSPAKPQPSSMSKIEANRQELVARKAEQKRRKEDKKNQEEAKKMAKKKNDHKTGGSPFQSTVATESIASTSTGNPTPAPAPASKPTPASKQKNVSTVPSSNNDGCWTSLKRGWGNLWRGVWSKVKKFFKGLMGFMLVLVTIVAIMSLGWAFRDRYPGEFTQFQMEQPITQQTSATGMFQEVDTFYMCVTTEARFIHLDGGENYSAQAGEQFAVFGILVDSERSPFYVVKPVNSQEAVDRYVMLSSYFANCTLVQAHLTPVVVEQTATPQATATYTPTPAVATAEPTIEPAKSGW